MRDSTIKIGFPQQKVSGAEKRKASWYANCIDFIIDTGCSINDRGETKTKLEIQHGYIPYEFYKKTLNPYNADKESDRNFPATMRNLDMINDVIRRYVSEYFKGDHNFTITACNPDIVLQKNEKLKETIAGLAQQAFMQEFQRRYQEMVQEAQQQGQDPNSVNPQDAMPDADKFIEDFNNNYIDDESKQAQDLLDYIRLMTDDAMIYLTAFFNYSALGECYTYTDIRGNQLIKECVPVMEAYPIPNNKHFVEDHDMFARRMELTHQQILDMFDKCLTDKDIKALDALYNRQSRGSKARLLFSYNDFQAYYPDVCDKFNDQNREFFKHNPVDIGSLNPDRIEVWHVVWRGTAKSGVLTYINEVGFQTTRVVDEDYVMNKEAGDISIDWEYIPQVYEGYRIGGYHEAIYPIKARAISYNRGGKLPYNGVLEVLPYLGKFSLIDILTPYQILRNIFSYHREMVIAKNKMLILLLPTSLIEGNADDVVYRMAAEGILPVNDEDDTSGVKMQQIRLLNANMGDYIRQLTELIDSLKLEGREMVDMNLQRYGEIANSAQVGTTKEAIARSSMGMVVLVTMFDEFRKRDYQRDIDYAKLAYIDGLTTSFYSKEKGKRVFISLDVNSFVNSDYSCMLTNDPKDLEKLDRLKEWAFNASQNGELEMAIAAITADNVAQAKKSIEKFAEIRRQHENEMKQLDQMLDQQKLQGKLQEIQAKGEQDRLTEELKYQYEFQLKGMDIDANAMLANFNAANQNKANGIDAVNAANLEREKLDLTREQMRADLYNKEADRLVKLKDIDSKIQIAKENKNRYDRK